MAAQNLPATQTAETKEITYTAADGSEIRLTPDMVRKYLVQGHGEMVTIQEMVYFLNVCRSRKLNPFIKDCYLIKYSQSDPAAVVTSVDYFRKRARAQKDCRGWKSGIIVKGKDGAVKDTAGLIQDGETLLGGWFEAKPDGWTDSLRLEVNLRGFIKKKQDGSVTRFWSPDNQPTQIAKVAESQGLRKLWPDEFQGMYAEEEITPDDRKQALDVTDTTTEKPDLSAAVAEFDRETADKTMMPRYIDVAVKHFKKPADEIKAEAMKDLPGFLSAYAKWEKTQAQKEAGKKATEKAQQQPADAMSGPCPKNGDTFKQSYCAGCPDFSGCPAWGTT